MKTTAWHFYLPFMLLVSACRPAGPEPSLDTQVAFSPPVMVSLDSCPAPATVALVNAMPPSVLDIPDSALMYSGTGAGISREGVAEAPAVTPATPPVVNFTNFDTEEGLALSSVTDKTSATFGNMDEGRYVFRVRAGGLVERTAELFLPREAALVGRRSLPPLFNARCTRPLPLRIP